MTCRRFQQQISPYLDQHLTGEQMLAMQQHWRQCPLCAEEYRAAREVKMLLRALPLHTPSRTLEQRIAQRVTAEPTRTLLWPPPARLSSAQSRLLSSLMLPRPQRGRRLATAFALSCVGLFTVAAPFAPPFADAALVRPAKPSGLGRLDMQAVPAADPRLGAVALVSPLAPFPAENSLLRLSLLGRTAPVQARFVQHWQEPPLSGPGEEPLGDEAVSGYASGDATLADFHSR